MEKIVKKHTLNDPLLIKDDVAYWLSKTPEERIEAVEILRKQFYGTLPRFQRVARVIQRSSH